VPVSAAPFLLIAALTVAMIGFVAVVIHLCFTRDDRAAMAAAFAVGFVLMPFTALAGDGTTVDLSPLLVTVVGTVGTAITAIVGILARALVRSIERRTGLEVDAHTRDYLEKALDRAISYGTAKAEAFVAKQAEPIDLHNTTVALAAQYALDRVPGALKHFGIDDISLHNMVEARLLMLVDKNVMPPAESAVLDATAPAQGV